MSSSYASQTQVHSFKGKQRPKVFIQQNYLNQTCNVRKLFLWMVKPCGENVPQNWSISSVPGLNETPGKEATKIIDLKKTYSITWLLTKIF